MGIGDRLRKVRALHDQGYSGPRSSATGMKRLAPLEQTLTSRVETLLLLMVVPLVLVLLLLWLLLLWLLLVVQPVYEGKRIRIGTAAGRELTSFTLDQCDYGPHEVGRWVGM